MLVQGIIRKVRDNPNTFDIQTIHQFRDAIDEAKFLFPRNVSETLEQIYKRMGDLNAIVAEIRSETIANGHAGVELPQKKLDAGKALSADLKMLPDTYADMQLF